MNPTAFPFLFFALAAIFVVLATIWVRRKAKQRAEDLRSVANSLGLNYVGDDSSRAVEVSSALFRRGSSRRFRNVMNGAYAGFQVSVFDYSYTVSSGKNSSTFTQTVAAFVQDRHLPLFELRPQGFLDRVAEMFVHKDINFESHPVFSKRFVLKGEDEASIRSLFTPALLSAFEMLPPEKKWHIEGGGVTLLIYRSNITVAPQDLRTFLDETSAVAQTFFASAGRS
jgi:hypothetical protein